MKHIFPDETGALEGEEEKQRILAAHKAKRAAFMAEALEHLENIYFLRERYTPGEGYVDADDAAEFLDACQEVGEYTEIEDRRALGSLFTRRPGWRPLMHEGTEIPKLKKTRRKANHAHPLKMWRFSEDVSE